MKKQQDEGCGPLGVTQLAVQVLGQPKAKEIGFGKRKKQPISVYRIQRVS